MSRRVAAAALLLQAAILAAPPLGQQTRIALTSGATSRARISEPRRRVTLDYLTFAAAEAKRIRKQARNLRNSEGFSRG